MFSELESGPATRVETSRENAVRVNGLRAVHDDPIEIPNGGLPVLLERGHVLGQTFTVDAGRFRAVQVLLPTWQTRDSGAVLRLRRDGPDGPVIAERRLQNVPDNSWQELRFPEQGPGRYVVELAEPLGRIGWWSGRTPSGQEGGAQKDGVPAPGRRRALRVERRRTLGEAGFEVSVERNRLVFSLTIRPRPGIVIPERTLILTARWDNSGYDTSYDAVPFARFFTPDMRYMPVHQLKRWKERNGRYELTLGPTPWIEADGAGPYDLRLHGRRLRLAWHLHGRETDLVFSAGALRRGERYRAEVTLEILPRADRLPEDWPQIALPDADASREANTFFYERAFSYPAVWGPAPWMEWNALCRAWQGGAHLDALRDFLASYPLDPDGYVHTWGRRRGWPFPDNRKYDTRHFDVNARFILGSWRYAAWTGDVDFLRRQLPRLRRAMEYQLDELHGRDGLIVTASKDVTGRHRGVGNNYWDILPFGHLDAYANIVWYASLEAMARIEQTAADAGISCPDPEGRSPSFYRALRKRVRAAYNRTCWDERAGRYIGCIDIDGKPHDYGFTFVNLEAMAYGLADAEQARRIFHWMETEPTSSGKPDTYSRWIFAPRANTIHNPRWAPVKGKLDDVPQEPWWHFGWRGTPYGDQCQDGGAILYTSYFDLMARTRFLGPDNALQRWREILGRWRLPDHLCGGSPLYRGEHPQQILPGAVGVDVPFPESSLVGCWWLYGVLGVDPTPEGLVIEPRLPSSLAYVEIRNVWWRGMPLDIRAESARVVVACRAPECSFRWEQPFGDDKRRVVFTKPPAPCRTPSVPLWRKKLPAPGWRAYWIWLPDSEAPKAYFRHIVELSSAPRRAMLAIAADNAWVLYVNGVRAGAGDRWEAPAVADVTRLLTTGRNVLAVECTNAGGPGGLLVQGAVTLADGRQVTVQTDSSWEVSPTPPRGWPKSADSGANWRQAVPYGKPPCGPWGDIGEPPVTSDDRP